MCVHTRVSRLAAAGTLQPLQATGYVCVKRAPNFRQTIETLRERSGWTWSPTTAGWSEAHKHSEQTVTFVC